jgi:uncharacterized membrane protein
VTTRAARLAVAALALVGITITSYLLYARATGTPIACATGGCETVQHSRYATLGGIPVAALGLAGYVGLLVTTLFRSEAARAAAIAISLVGVAFGAYLIVVQLTVLDAVCVWCLASDAVVFAIATVCVTDAVRQAPGDTSLAGG